jgi:hypothetical protein
VGVALITVITHEMRNEFYLNSNAGLRAFFIASLFREREDV